MTEIVNLKRDALINEINRRNISRNHFAANIGISKSYCSQLLNGHRRPSATVRQKIMDETKLGWDHLFASVPATSMQVNRS